LKGYFKKYTCRGISFKLLTSSILLILFSIFLVSFLSYNQYTNDLKAQSSGKVQQIIELVSLNIDTYLDDLFRLSLSPYYNNDVIDALDKRLDDSDLKTLNRTRTIEGFLDQMMIIPRKDILRVYILSEDIYKSERINTALDTSIKYEEFQWYKDAITTQQPVFVPAHLEQMVKNPKNIVFSVANVVKSTRNTNRILGVIKVDANYSGIKTICNRVNMGQKGGLFIIDENKNIIFSSIDSSPYTELFKQVSTLNKPYKTYKYNNDNLLLNSTKILRSNWTIIAVNSLDEINSTAIKTRNHAFLIALLCSAFAIFILIVFVKWFLEPLLYIVKDIRLIQKGDLSVIFPDYRNDEIGYLGLALNKMVTNINSMMTENTNLVKEVYEAKYLQKEAQIYTLFNQIRPHFIYNTLNMISLLIQCGRDENAVDNINKLSSILRGMANWDKDITVEQEITLLDAYLGIQQSRYENRLEYFINIDNSLYPFVIPALILQPIVENSVIHVCEKRREKTIIKIWSIEESDNLIFNVQDNGEGISSEALETLRYKLENHVENKTDLLDLKSKISGIGLVNVNRRIKIKYGKEYGLFVESDISSGTLIKVILPKNTFTEGVKNV
jgi:two-component system sensor histidine kinase YesM